MNYDFIKNIYLANPALVTIGFFLAVVLLVTIYYCYKNIYKSPNSDSLESLKYILSTVSVIDTYDKKNNFFSARRSLRLKHDDYGRNISIIMIN